MDIKDLPHVTVEQVLALREAAIEIEQQLAELKASLPKVRADAIREAARLYTHKWQDEFSEVAIALFKRDEGYIYPAGLKEFARELEAGEEQTEDETE